MNRLDLLSFVYKTKTTFAQLFQKMEFAIDPAVIVLQ